MSLQTNPTSHTDAACPSAQHADGEGVSKPALRRRIALLVIEVLLVVIIVGLLIATWLPAIIGANPDAPRGGPLP